jgi:hypothetical protein
MSLVNALATCEGVFVIRDLRMTMHSRPVFASRDEQWVVIGRTLIPLRQMSGSAT